MASDLDEELLAAAGCTGKGRSRPSKRRISKDSEDSDDSAREEEEEEEEEEEDDDDDSDAPMRKTQAMASRRQQSGFPDDEDDDDDEQEDSLSELSFGESLYKDEEDRARLDAMREVDREMIFLERGDRLQEHKQREMKKARKREELKEGRTRAPVTPPSTRRADMTSTPSSGRSRVLRSLKEREKKEKILSNLVALKESKSRDSALKRRRFETPPSDEDEEDDTSASRSPDQIPTLEDEEEVLSGNISPRVVEAQQGRKGEEPTFQDIADITIRRSKLAKWLSEPYFENVVIGCFVRLAVGEDSSTGYHLCQVTGIEVGDPSRTYKLENRTTHKYMSCAFGNKVFTTSMSRVSEQPPMEQEFDEWRLVVEEDLSIYNGLVAEKAVAISKVGTFVYSADTVKQMIEEKKKSAGHPFNLAAEKDRVARELALAEHEHPSDTAKIGQLQAQLRQLEALGAQRRAKDAKAIALAEMNRRNREENFRNASQRKMLESGQDGYDPFSRRWTRSQNYYSKAPAPQPKVDPVVVPIVNVAEQVAQKEAAEAGKLVNTAPPSNRFVQLHRFELPLDLSRLQNFGSGPPAAALAYLGNRQRIESIYGPPVQVHDPHTHPQTLSINDYKRRMNLID